MENVIGIIFLILVCLLVLAYVGLIILTMIHVDWRNRWKTYIKESVILYISMWILVAVLNPSCIELQQTVGWTLQTFEHITFIGTMSFLIGLPFVNLRNTKW